MTIVATPSAHRSTVAITRKRLSRRGNAVNAALVLAVVAAFAIFLCLGDYPVPIPDVVRSLLSPVTGLKDRAVDFIVLTVRLPRAMTALLTGAAFGMAGHIFQTLLRNPLASPDIVGISTGASAAAVAAIILFGLGGIAVSLSALGGAVATALAIYWLAWRGGAVSPYRMVLIGIGLAAMLSASISFTFTRARVEDVQHALAWLVGSLNGSTLDQLAPLAILMLVLVPGAFALVGSMQTLELGDDAAKGLGTRVELSRISLMLIAVALAAFATAVAGPVAFVSFVAGPIARQLLGPARSALGASALVGTVVMLVSDLIAQHLIGSTQLPVGVVTGALGAVFLIYLLMTTNRQGRGG
jgi:iron complex transport system permease protein